MANTLLMPKATAVWLVDNTALSFDQIAQFCGLHPLEVKAIADGEAAQGIKGMDPIMTGQLTREEIARAEKEPNHKLKLSDPKVRVPESKRKAPRYTPLSKRQDRPNAILWLVRNQLGLCSQIDLDLEVQRASRGREQAPTGDTLLPAALTERLQPAQPKPRDQDEELDADAVFAKLSALKGRTDEDEE